MKRTSLLCIALFASIVTGASAESGRLALPHFEATSLERVAVSDRDLRGHPAILIVTPSRDAAAETRAWARRLEKATWFPRIAVRDLLCIDLPFFADTADAVTRARRKIPPRYYRRTWVVSTPGMAKAFDIPASSAHAFVLVIDAAGEVVARVGGEPDDRGMQKVTRGVHATSAIAKKAHIRARSP